MHEKRRYVESQKACPEPEPRALLLVEGRTDRIALEAAARKLGRDLRAERVQIVELGGAHAIGGFLALLDPRPPLRLAGLCDAREEPVFRRALEAAGVDGSRFHVCVRDLEDELIRTVGAEATLAVLASHGDLGAFRTFERQPAWRGRSLPDQLRRFLSSSDNRKARYARHLVDALDPAQIPRPLRAVLDAVE